MAGSGGGDDDASYRMDNNQAPGSLSNGEGVGKQCVW